MKDIDKIITSIQTGDYAWIKLCEEKGIILSGTQCEQMGFNWMEWREGQVFADSRNWDFDDKDKLFCQKLLTAIIRNDRFSDGYLDQKIENGLVIRILERLKKLI